MTWRCKSFPPPDLIFVSSCLDGMVHGTPEGCSKWRFTGVYGFVFASSNPVADCFDVDGCHGRLPASILAGLLGLGEAATASLGGSGGYNPCGADALPITHVFGRAESTDFGAIESGTCEGRFQGVFGTALESPTGGANTDAQPLRYDLPRGAGGSERGHLYSIHRGTGTPQLFAFCLG